LARVRADLGEAHREAIGVTVDPLHPLPPLGRIVSMRSVDRERRCQIVDSACGLCRRAELKEM